MREEIFILHRVFPFQEMGERKYIHRGSRQSIICASSMRTVSTNLVSQSYCRCAGSPMGRLPAYSFPLAVNILETHVRSLVTISSCNSKLPYDI